MDETHKLAAIVAPISWICGLIGWLILFFTLNKSIRSAWSISYVIGIMTALLNLGLMVKGSKHIQKNALNPYNKSVKVNILYYILRIILFTAIFAMIITDQYIFNSEAPKFNVWATLIGYSLVKIILLTVVLVMKGKVKNE